MRIIIVPMIVLVYFSNASHANLICTVLFTLAGVTDWFDGYLARKYKMESKLGAFLDPVADKLIVTIILVLLVSSSRVLETLWNPVLFVVSCMIIIGREITVSALREWMAEIGERASVSVSLIGKIKTTFQMISIGMLLYLEPLFGLSIARIGEVLFYIAAALTLWSMTIYLTASWRVINKS